MEAGAGGLAPPLTLEPLLLPLSEDAPTLCTAHCSLLCNYVQHTAMPCSTTSAHCHEQSCEPLCEYYGLAVQSLRSGCGDFPP